MNQIFKVVSQSETITVPSMRSENGQTYKSNIVLREVDGKHANTYVATLFGKDAQCRFYEGELVVAALYFSVHEHNGQSYQDVVVDEIVKLS